MSGRGGKRDYSRGTPRLEPLLTLYIICEGEKTEYLYLRAIRTARRLRSVRVDIDPGSRSGSNPKSLLDYARKKLTHGGYDEVWCVFDDDGRADARDVLRDAERAKVRVAFSNPCFELWYLLHYRYSTGGCTQDEMLDRLKEHIPGYAKNENVFEQLPERSAAVRRAQDLRQHHVGNGGKPEDNPSTSVDVLVELLYSVEDVT